MIGHTGRDRFQQIGDRVARNIKTAFASHYTKEISLDEMMQPEVIRACAKQVKGENCPANPTSRLLATKLLMVFAPVTGRVTGEI
jgi:hypothetical protein